MGLVLLAGALVDLAQLVGHSTASSNSGGLPPPGGPVAVGADTSPASAVLAGSGTSAARSYTVVRGDRLSEIARRHDTTVPVLVTLNGIEDPNQIVAGQVLLLPEPAAGNDQVER